VKNGLILQFGVYDGWSLEQIAAKYPDRTIYGFDSFEGIEEDWGILHKKGAMKTTIPIMPDNVRLVVGMIENTLPDFLSEHDEPITFVHIDTDTYTPAKFILDHIRTRLIPGSVILFDEYWNYPGWEEHEYRAFKEFQKENPCIRFGQDNETEYFKRSICSMGWRRLVSRLVKHPVRVIKSGLRRICGNTNDNHPSMAFEVKQIL